ncbi:ABC transporter-like [Parasponia andersonii]|uniref:ABC transporter-like n=1 Tax=Parasponia andersonii TaxID=3476 RepID=A0A2P5DPY6_PARAD|nr:ABC transporter-like [Parasponia andersonii]
MESDQPPPRNDNVQEEEITPSTNITELERISPRNDDVLTPSTKTIELEQLPPRNDDVQGEEITPSTTTTELEQLPPRNDDVQGEEITPSTSHHQVIDIAEVTQNEPRPLSFVLCFSNLTYSVKLRPNKLSSFRGAPEPGEKTILNDISGEAYDGEILALLGASGSGKTTLIDALADRIEKESLKGTVTLNGEFVESRLKKAITGYVMQDDLLYPMLTVEETLTFAAEFRLPRTLPESRKKARVQALIDQLGLRSAANTIIGDEGHRGVSGGERRRVSIGIGVIHDPILLFLDEPTSGLDSTSAFMVVKVLKRIAESGSVVVMSVHQPSYRILDLLDRLIFLSDGRMVYKGSPGNLPLFCSAFGYPIPEKANQVEFLLDLISEVEASPAGITSLVEFNKNSGDGAGTDDRRVPPLKEALIASISRGKFITSNNNNKATSSDGKFSSGIPNFANPIWVEVLVLTKRSMINLRRTPGLFATPLITVLTTGLLLATIYWRLDDSMRGIRERMGFFAFAISTTYFSSCQSLPLLLQERFIFTRETAFNAYRRLSYTLSHAITVLPLLLVLSLGFSTATFWAVGLAGGLSGFAFYLSVVSGSFWAGNSLVVFLSGLVSHVLVGYTVVVAVSAYFLLLSGFFISRNRIPDYWIWFHYLSLIKYPYEAVMRNEFRDPARCFERAVELFDDTPFATASAAVKEVVLGNLSAAVGVNVTGTTCLMNGLDVLKELGISELSKWGCLGVLVAWGFFYRILFYVSLLVGRKNKRK